MKLILRWLITAASLYVAYLILPGITVEGNGFWVYSIMALILGLVNALIRPILKFLSCGFIIITLGLFVFVINAVTFMLSANISQSLGFNFAVDGFGTALLASIIVSFVSVVLSSILIDEDKRK